VKNFTKELILLSIYNSSEPEPEEIKEEVTIIFLLGLGHVNGKISPLRSIIISSL